MRSYRCLLVLLLVCFPHINPQAKVKSKKNEQSIWIESTDVSPITDSVSYYATQIGSQSEWHVRCRKGEINVFFTFPVLVFEPQSFAYRVDRHKPVFEHAPMIWQESSDSKAIGLWEQNIALNFLAELVKIKGEILHIELEYKYGSIGDSYSLADIELIINKAMQMCPLNSESGDSESTSSE